MLNNIRDRLLSVELKKDEKEVKIGFIVITFILLFILTDIVYITYSLNNSKHLAVSSASNPTLTPKISTAPSQNTTPTPTPAANPTASSPKTSSEQSSVKDYYFNLGTGSNQSTDWADVPGALSTFDIAQYQNIKEVHLETNINVPTANGTVSIRLFNKTDNYAVRNSEREVQSQTTGDLIISQNIIYDVGPKLYQVQMKTQLGVVANLVQSRIHVILK